MNNRMDKHNYSFSEKNSHQISNKLKEKNSSKGKTRVYNGSTNNRKSSTLRTAKKEKAQALDKECKRMAVLYPFLTKNQIRSKAKEALTNANVSSKWQSAANPKRKTALNFISESRGKHQEQGDTVSEEDSDFEQNTKNNCKTKSPRQKVYDVDEDDEDDNKDPDYKPKTKNQTVPIPKPSKSNPGKEPRTKKPSKTCEFMDLGESSAYTADEYDYAPDERPSCSKLKPLKQVGSRKAQTQNLSTMRSYKSTHQRKGVLPNKPKENQTADADDTFDKLLIDDGTPRSHVSESPDSTTPTISAANPVIEPPVLQRYSCLLSHDTSPPDANATNNTPQSQADEDIFAKSKEQRPFPKYSVENGYDVITLSSDSEDEVTSTVRPVLRIARCSPMNTGQIKLEKDVPHSSFKEQPKNSSLKVQPKKSPLIEQPKKPPLVRNPTPTNVQPPSANSRNKTDREKRQVPMPRGILKRTPQQICQVVRSNGQTSRTVQTPKIVKYQTPPKIKKDVSTQMSPPRSAVQIKVRPQMVDEASEANLVDECPSESSSLVECDVSPLQQQLGVSSFQQQLDDAMRRIEKTVMGRARQFRRVQVATPKLRSSQTQTDPITPRKAGNVAGLRFLPTLNLETPRKRYVSWKEDRIVDLTADDELEKPLALALKCESDHDRFLYSVKLELAQLGNDISNAVAPTGPEFSNLDVTSPGSVASVQEIPLDDPMRYGIPNAPAERDFDNEWFNIFKSPVRSRSNLIHAENESTAAPSLNLKYETDESSDTVGSAVLSALKNSATPENNVGNTVGGNFLPNASGLALPLSSSQDSTETTRSSTSTADTGSREDLSEMDSEASSSPRSPPDKLAREVRAITRPLAPTRSVDPGASLLDTLLAKMRSFSTASSAEGRPASSPFTPGLFTWSSFALQKKNVSEPPQKKLKVASPRTLKLLQESSTLTSEQLFRNQDGKSPKTPKNAAKKAYEDNRSLAKGSSARRENDEMTEQANTSAKSALSRKDDFLCDLFDVATPKSEGGTINRYLGYSRELSPHSIFDEDCSDAFG